MGANNKTLPLLMYLRAVNWWGAPTWKVKKKYRSQSAAHGPDPIDCSRTASCTRTGGQTRVSFFISHESGDSGGDATPGAVERSGDVACAHAPPFLRPV